jgi:hypothetical protein
MIIFYNDLTEIKKTLAAEKHTHKKKGRFPAPFFRFAKSIVKQLPGRLGFCFPGHLERRPN